MEKLHGIYPALVTPFDAAGKFTPPVFERLLARVYDAGVNGVYVLGSTGEGIPQTVAQRKTVTEAALAGSPSDKRVIVHVGALTTADAVELAQHAARQGAHAVSSLPPPGNYSLWSAGSTQLFIRREQFRAPLTSSPANVKLRPAAALHT